MVCLSGGQSEILKFKLCLTLWENMPNYADKEVYSIVFKREKLERTN